MTTARTMTGPPNVPLAPEPVDQRFVYNGETITPGIDPTIRTNRPVRRRQRSPFASMFVLLTISLLVVFYIWNKITVNRLNRDVEDLRIQYAKLVNANDILRAEITQKSRLERIEKIAVDQLKMTYPKEQPVWFEIDPEKSAAISRSAQ